MPKALETDKREDKDSWKYQETFRSRFITTFSFGKLTKQRAIAGKLSSI